jgi:hypothetical protein
MIHCLVRHKVADFPKWKDVYESNLKMRKDAGFKEEYLWSAVDNPNELYILFKVKDIESAKTFVNSPQIRDVMRKAGVIGEPELHFLNRVESPAKRRIRELVGAKE